MADVGVFNCENCGAELNAGARFCKNCGASLGNASMLQGSHATSPQSLQQAPAIGTRATIDISKLPISDIVVLICSFVMFILAAQPWYKIVDRDYEELFVKTKVWPQNLVFAFALVLFIITIAAIIDRYLHLLPSGFRFWYVYLGLSVLILIFLILSPVVQPSSYTYLGMTQEVGRDVISFGWGLWVSSIIFLIGIITGSLLNVRDVG